MWKRLPSLGVIGFLGAVPLVASAALYFEFSPDFREPFLVATATTVEQVFLPLNDHLHGIDFWVSNDDTPAVVTFTLLSPTGTTMTSRTATIGAIADGDLGQRYTVTFPIQVTVTPDATYRVRIETSSATLRLYWAAANRLLSHNAPPPSAYSSGTARIDGSDRAESFLYALYETTESSPPVISGLTVQQPLVGQARIEFNASEPVDSTLRYGPYGQPMTGLVDFTGGYQSCVAGVQLCTVSFAVTPGTAYAYELTVRDIWGNESSITGEFTSTGMPPAESVSPTGSPPSSSDSPSPTPIPPDTTAPTITNVRAANITDASVTIAWTTNEAANGLVVVQSLPFLISAGGNSDSTLELEHAITVNNIGSDALYLARITTSDGSGNSTVATTSFQTLAATPPPAPSGSSTPTPSATPGTSPTPTPTISVGPSGETQWSPPASGTPTDGYRIDIIGADGKLIRTIRTNDTSINLGDIPDGATVIVYAINDGVYEKVAAPKTIHRGSTLERLLAALPYILGGLVIVIGATIGILKLRQRRKAALPPAAPPPPLTGAQPNPSAF